MENNQVDVNSGTKIKILHLEDDKSDAEIIRITLEMAKLDCAITHAKNRIEFEEALLNKNFDIILGDYRLPGYDGTSGLKLASEICPDVPFIFVSGTMGEDAAIEGLTLGATDYVLKQKLSRLVPAINRALSEVANLKKRKQAEDELLDSMMRFRAVADSAIEGIISSDSMGHIIYWNKAAKTIFGYSEKEVIGKKISILFPERLREEYIGRIGFEVKFDIQRLIGRTVEGIGCRKSGEEFPLDLSIANWKTKDGTFFTAMARDISQRKEAERNLKIQSAALAAAANGIVITNNTGEIAWVNPAFSTMTGYSPQDVIGKNPRILKSAQHNKKFYTNMWETILSGRVWKGEIINRKADGSLYTEEMTIAPVRESKGEISHFIAIKQDVSDRKQHEHEREAIISVSNVMRNAITRNDLLKVFFKQIVELFDANGSMLVKENPIDKGAIIEYGYGVIGERFSGLYIPPGKGISNRVINEGKPYLNNNASSDPEFFRSDLLGDSVAVACVPLVAQMEVIGALWLVRKKAITEKEINLLFAIANLAANAIHRVTLFEQTEHQLHRMGSLHQIDVAISSVFNLKKVFDVLLKNTVEQLGIDAASVLLKNQKTGYLEFITGIGFISKTIKKTKISIGEGRAGLAASERKVISVPDLNIIEDSFSQNILQNEEHFISHYVAPLIIKGEVIGVLEAFCRKRIETTHEWFNFFEALATQAAIAVDNATLFNSLQKTNKELITAYEATIEGWSIALDMRDKETEGHTQRVTKLSEELGKSIGLLEPDLINIRRGALLHDIGKMGVPDSILLKPDKLTEDEWKIMKMHPSFAYEMLEPIKYLGEAIQIPFCHHEKWDGTGYPRGLKKTNIPIIARIFAITDVWDAITSDRPYRNAWSKEKSIEYMREQSGKQFDPELIPIFLKMIT
jgi:PAS domain S-box-containing protein/putative nucleotidyltransferase with HDIG domain